MLSLQKPKDSSLILRWTILVLFLNLLSGCCGHKLQLHPNLTELQINEGESLEITCKSSHRVYFDYPDKNEDSIITSQYNITRDEKDGITTFQRASLVFGDSGWYNCTSKRDTIVEINSHNLNTSGIYIFVKTNRSTFVQISNDLLKRKVRIGDQVVLPCRPTSPKFNVTLTTLDGLEPQMVISKRASFYPKLGFVIQKSELSDSSNYTCEVNQDGFTQKIYAELLVIKKEQKKPVITINGLEHVVVGSTLNISCTVEIEKNNPYNITWETPRDSIPRKTYNHVEENKSHSSLVTSSLILNNVSHDDEAPDEVPKVFLTDVSGFKYLYPINKNATFKCSSYGYPKANISWFFKQCPTNSYDHCNVLKLKGREIKLPYTDAVYSRITINVTTLGILNCKACNHHLCFLKQKDISIVDKEDFKEHLKIVKDQTDFFVGDNVTFTCAFINYMFKNVAWFKRLPFTNNYENMNITGKNSSYVNRAVLSIKNVQISDQANYYCKGQYVQGGDIKKSFNLRVQEPETPTIIRTNMNDTEKVLSWRDALNTITLLCKTKGLPEPDITWQKDGSPLKLSNQFSVAERNQKLIINFLFEWDSGNYSCLAKNRFGKALKDRSSSACLKVVQGFKFLED
ncbi:hemicentin-1-like [Copidosoma floridanum]|uniref:hemicentin-1-like n=1 Tax=Copidosoma floridanum TaxID=29053 RepID=UPI0006C9A842|nr:hemicentin-1-like [Copidosoma floridanum]